MGQIFITLIISIIILALAVIGVLALYFFFWRPLLELTKTARLARTTKNWKMPNFSRFIFLGPLASEIYKMALGLKSARQSAREEARLKLEKSDTPWTEERLKEFMKSYLKDRNIYMVSSTEPYVHEKKGNKISRTFRRSSLILKKTSLSFIMSCLPVPIAMRRIMAFMSAIRKFGISTKPRCATGFCITRFSEF